MNPLHELIEHGQSCWLDNLTRTMIHDGTLARRLRDDGLRGVTSNPAIFNKAISGGTAYEGQIRELVGEGLPVEAIYERLVVTDVRDACDVLRGVYDESEGRDGFISLEVSPYLIHDTEATIAEARRLFRSVDRPNVLIKIPGSQAGVPAIEQMLYEGVNVNVTLLFAIDAYEAVAEAYVRAMGRRLDENKPVERVASVASFFLSRIDVLVDQLLGHRIDPADTTGAGPRPEQLLGKAAVANAKLAYQSFQRIFSGERWRRLDAAGARVQRVLWASTSTKDPLYSDVRYVEPLIGPDTVNTMPDETIAAFADHGRVASGTVTTGVDEARHVMDALAEVGIDMQAVTWQLLNEGAQKFIDPFDSLMATIERQRQQVLGGGRRSYDAGESGAGARAALASFDRRQMGRRLWAKDPTVWHASGDAAKVVRNRLGWLDSVALFRERAGELTAFAHAAKDEGIRHVVHLGMGGSSLCPEVAHEIFGAAPGWPELIVLDNTDPDAVRDVEKRIELGASLFIVASKSGTTTETLSFYRYFWERTRQTGLEPGPHFVAITDADTPLEEEAKAQGFRHAFINPGDIGGRYSALSYFGLVPMALMGMDVGELLARAHQEAIGCGGVVPGASNPGVHLGAVIGMQARAGRDKLTFQLGRPVAAFGYWVEQLIAESTGKHGRGILPVEEEELGEPGVYGSDRLFVGLTLADDGPDGGLDRLAAAGHPVVRIALADRLDLGAQFFRWEMATAVAGAVIGVNPFDEPNVAESKKNTHDLLEQWKTERGFNVGGPSASGDGLEVYGGAGGSPGAVLRGLLDGASAGDYVALLAYFTRRPERHSRLQKLRHVIRERRKVATTLGYGPRYLHSTGQLHKGGPDTGVFVVLTADPSADLAIPGSEYGFATLRRAQALGDYRSLVDHGRRVVRIHLGRDVERGLETLLEAVEGGGR